ncbi:MAG: hypothetical protein PHF00_14105, partial [Elusimicrobia bacterium]|nr:hypothetical protein [Elusimicrobiota bacterium]
VVAMIAAGAAVVCGIMMTMKPYSQVMQGLMFAGIGAIIAFQAGMVLVNSNAAEESKTDISAKTDASAKEMPADMRGGQSGGPPPGAETAPPAQEGPTMVAQAPKGLGNVPPET